LTSGMEALIDLRTATVPQFDAAEQTCLDLDQDTALAAAPGPGAPPVARMPLGVNVSRLKRCRPMAAIGAFFPFPLAPAGVG
jgi:hypothetical protein